MRPFTSRIRSWLIQNGENEWNKKTNRFGVPVDHVVDYHVAVKYEGLNHGNRKTGKFEDYALQFENIRKTFEYLLSKRIVSECSRDELVRLEGLVSNIEFETTCLAVFNKIKFSERQNLHI